MYRANLKPRAVSPHNCQIPKPSFYCERNEVKRSEAKLIAFVRIAVQSRKKCVRASVRYLCTPKAVSNSGPIERKNVSVCLSVTFARLSVSLINRLMASNPFKLNTQERPKSAAPTKLTVSLMFRNMPSSAEPITFRVMLTAVGSVYNKKYRVTLHLFQKCLNISFT